MLKNKLLQFLCLFLLAFSLVGGLYLPLSPNIENATFVQHDSLMTFRLYIPKVEEKSELFLMSNALKKEDKKCYKPIRYTQKGDSVVAEFYNPEYYPNAQIGHSFDLILQNATDGQMVYFSAYTVGNPVENAAVTAKIQAQEVPKTALISVDKFKWSFPNRGILRESIRNLFFHVPMWFAMIAMLFYSLVQSIGYLNNMNLKRDTEADFSVRIGLFFGTLGILTGMVWAKNTWGAYWTDDPKLNGAAIGILVYCAYMILRSSVEDPLKKGKLAAVYNIFAFTIYIVFIFILPKVNSSLHPGNGGNPGFNVYEQNSTMRLFFYPAVAGWILMAFWLKELWARAMR